MPREAEPNARLEEGPELGALLQGLAPRMRAVALRFTRDSTAADDVVQNAFLKVCRHRDRFRGEARVSTWLHRIVVNESLMWLRSQRRRHARSQALEGLPRVADPAPGAEERLLAQESQLRLRRGLASLGAEEREVLWRCAIEERSYDQYAREAGLHPAAVKSRAFRARHRLRRALRSA